MTSAREYAAIFHAAADGIDRILPWNHFKYHPLPSGVRSATGPTYRRDDYAQQEAMCAAFRGVAEMFERIAQATPDDA